MKRRQFLSSLGAGAVAGLLPTGSANAFMAGQRPRLVALAQPRMADEVCKNYLINTKIFYAPTVYGHTDAVVDLLVDLGVRGIRERVTTGTSLGTKAQLNAMPRLANQGVKWHATVGTLEDWTNATAVNRDAMAFLASRYAPAVGGDLSKLLHSFGGCNEIEGPGLNGRTDPDWAPHARIMQKALWEQARSNRATADIAIAGPSTRTDFTSQKAAMLGDLSAICDWATVTCTTRARARPTRSTTTSDCCAPASPARAST